MVIYQLIVAIIDQTGPDLKVVKSHLRYKEWLNIEGLHIEIFYLDFIFRPMQILYQTYNILHLVNYISLSVV